MDYEIVTNESLTLEDIYASFNHVDLTTPLMATTPHGSYTFDITAAVYVEGGPIMLMLREIGRAVPNE